MRAAVYIRESTVRQMEEGFSPDAQRSALAEYAEKHGYKVVAEYKDAESGKRETRTGFQALAAAAERSEFDAILCFRSSRFARNVEVARRYKRLIRAKGIKVISLDVDVDPETPSGFLLEGVHEVLDEHYSRQLGDWTRAGLRAKKDKGLHVGPIPVGWDRVDGKLVPNADAKLVKQAFKRYASGRCSTQEVANWLAAQGLRSRRKDEDGKPLPLSLSGVMAMLQNSVHVPLIGQQTYDEVQRQLRWRKQGETRTKKHRVYALSGLLRCAACGAKWRGRVNVDRHGVETRWYWCYGKGDHGCTGRVTKVKAVELERPVATFIAKWMELIMTTTTRKDLAKQLRAEQPNRAKERARLEAKLQRVKFQHEEGDLTDDEYRQKRDALREELAVVPPTELPTGVNEVFDTLVQLSTHWDELPPATQRDILRKFVQEINVGDGIAQSVKLTPDLAVVVNVALEWSRSEQHYPQV